MANRPVVVDLTYVAARLQAPTPTGIERVDAAFARHFVHLPERGGTDAARAVHYGIARPHLLLPTTARALITEAGAAWRPTGGWRRDPVYRAVEDWLDGPPSPFVSKPEGDRPAKAAVGAGRRARLRWRLAANRGAVVPLGAIYLNVAQYAFEYPVVFRWLKARPDVVPVFFIHDLLPLDSPEFFRAGYEALFERRVATMARFAKAAIVSSEAVGERVAAEMRRRGRDALPILCAHLPPPAGREDGMEEDGTEEDEADDPPMGDVAPYCVMIGTIEPRKNHLGVLHAWRALVEARGPVPRLVLVGPRGWENEQVVDLLERSRSLAPHVAEVSAISTPGLHRLISHARAVLMPSFAEGYGLPIAEALAAGTPVVASDIPVFREVSQGRAMLLDPTDGPAWRRAIADITAPASPLRAALSDAARRYVSPAWPDYFAKVEAFLAGL